MKEKKAEEDEPAESIEYSLERYRVYIQLYIKFTRANNPPKVFEAAS